MSFVLCPPYRPVALSSRSVFFTSPSIHQNRLIMIRWFFKLFYLVGSICSIAIMCKILAGQSFTRQPPSDLFRSDNKSDISESWPFKMQLHLINYVCNTPIPNVEVTEESLQVAWHLPPKTRLSPIMRAIGLCQLVAKEMASKGIEFDTSNCHCIDSWPVFTLVMVVFCLVFNVYRLIFGSSIDESPNPDGSGLAKMYFLSCIPFFVLFAALTPVACYVSDATDFGLSYTPYGDMYPISYYKKSAEWISVLDLSLITYFVNGCECLAWAFLNFGCCNIVKKTTSWIKPKVKILISIPSHAYGSGAKVVVKEKFPL